MRSDDEPKPTCHIVEADDLAADLGYNCTEFKRQLALMGWTMVLSEAERLACADNWERNETLPERSRRLWDGQITWKHLRDAAASFIPPKKALAAQPVRRKAGWVYVLYDPYNEMCKIGCTASASTKRQKSIMGGHGHKLINLPNVKVKDRCAAERQCHQNFQQVRRNGEWFHLTPDVIVKYIHENLEWEEFDCENLATVLEAICNARLNKDSDRHRQQK